MSVKDFNIDSIEPDPKDYDRAVGISSVRDEYTPDTGKSLRMANAIKDPYKMVRRAKAVVGVWGTGDYESGSFRENVWIPFEQALRRMGFTEAQIYNISQFEIDEELLE